MTSEGPLRAADPANTITIRQAGFADLDTLAVLLDLHRAAQGQASDVPAARAFLQARMDHGESVVFIAHGTPAAKQAQDVHAAKVEQDREDTPGAMEALGLAQVYPSFSSTSLARVWVLNDLFVAPAGRRRGVATALLAAVEQQAWQLGAVRVTLNVARNNADGQALYRARGWQQDQQFYMFHRFPPGL